MVTSWMVSRVTSETREPGLNGGEEQCVVPAAVPGRAIRRREQGVGLRTGQVGNDRSVVAALRDREDLADGVGSVRDERQRIAVEGVDRGQACVAGRRAVVAFVVEVVEEGADGGGVELVEGKPGGTLVRLPRGEQEQQFEGVTVCRDGLRAGLQLPAQSFGEEALQQ